jgi:thioredoxin-related protein
MKIFLLSVFLNFLFFTIPAQTPPSAEQVLKEAQAEAVKQNKNVFIIFHASWCGWCHKMDSSMNDRSCKRFFDDNYVIRHLVVQESKNKKNLENPGAMELLTRYNGADQGIPYWLVFDKQGKLLADSRIPSADSGTGANKWKNSGCPAAQEEVDYFISVLKKTSSLNDQDAAIIAKRFRENE